MISPHTKERIMLARLAEDYLTKFRLTLNSRKTVFECDLDHVYFEVHCRGTKYVYLKPNNYKEETLCIAVSELKTLCDKYTEEQKQEFLDDLYSVKTRRVSYYTDHF